MEEEGAPSSRNRNGAVWARLKTTNRQTSRERELDGTRPLPFRRKQFDEQSACVGVTREREDIHDTDGTN
jgi:hypothetical protein